MEVGECHLTPKEAHFDWALLLPLGYKKDPPWCKLASFISHILSLCSKNELLLGLRADFPHLRLVCELYIHTHTHIDTIRGLGRSQKGPSKDFWLYLSLKIGRTDKFLQTNSKIDGHCRLTMYSSSSFRWSIACCEILHILKDSSYPRWPWPWPWRTPEVLYLFNKSMHIQTPNFRRIWAFPCWSFYQVHKLGWLHLWCIRSYHKFFPVLCVFGPLMAVSVLKLLSFFMPENSIYPQTCRMCLLDPGHA